jgi:sulfur carrier protein
MKLTLNGETTEIAAGTTVLALLTTRKVDGRKVAVERNGAIVPKSTYAETILAEDDRIEIIGFIGGG